MVGNVATLLDARYPGTGIGSQFFRFADTVFARGMSTITFAILENTNIDLRRTTRSILYPDIWPARSDDHMPWYPHNLPPDPGDQENPGDPGDPGNSTTKRDPDEDGIDLVQWSAYRGNYTMDKTPLELSDKVVIVDFDPNNQTNYVPYDQQ